MKDLRGTSDLEPESASRSFSHPEQIRSYLHLYASLFRGRPQTVSNRRR
jgi:hypothetical protein